MRFLSEQPTEAGGGLVCGVVLVVVWCGVLVGWVAAPITAAPH